jgi:hypothetical protein
MTFEEYYQTMKEHGICELFFLYNDKECHVFMAIHGFSLYYSMFNGETNVYFKDLDELVTANFFDGKSLKDIWEEKEILSIDGVSEEEYNAETCSFHYVKYLQEQGDLQWSCSLGVKRSFFFQLKYACFGLLLFTVPWVLFPILQLSNWNIMILVGGCAVFSLVIASIALLQNRLDINYEVTTKKIFAFKGLSVSTTYDNIKRVKLKKSIFNKKRGTIKIYLKKGLSLNYHFEWIEEPEKVYALILENIEKQAKEKITG